MRHVNHIGIFWQEEIRAIGKARLGQLLADDRRRLLIQRASKSLLWVSGSVVSFPATRGIQVLASSGTGCGAGHNQDPSLCSG